MAPRSTPLGRSQKQERRTAQAFGAKQHAGSGNKPLRKNDSHTSLLHIENKRNDVQSRKTEASKQRAVKQITIKGADLIDVEQQAALSGSKIPVLGFELAGRDYCVVLQSDLVEMAEIVEARRAKDR